MTPAHAGLICVEHDFIACRVRVELGITSSSGSVLRVTKIHRLDSLRPMVSVALVYTVITSITLYTRPIADKLRIIASTWSAPRRPDQWRRCGRAASCRA